MSSSRDILLPIGTSVFPRDDVQRALERIGCTITATSDTEISGTVEGSTRFITISVMQAGQQLWVRAMAEYSRLFGGKQSQATVDRFVQEWSNRNKYRTETPEQRANAEAFARKNAKDTATLGIAMTVGGAISLGIGLLAIGQDGSIAGPLHLIGIGLTCLAIGPAKISAGRKRLKKS